MLEDHSVMDKNGRGSQVPCKSGTEKKNTDLNLGTKPFNKNSRRREPATSSNGRTDQGRKNATKGGKLIEKKSRPRGQYYGGGKAETKVDCPELDPDYGSLCVPGKKKQTLNHLLNFTLTPRSSDVSVGNARERQSYHWLGTTHKHKYNKEQFLQSNCQFVVKVGPDYSGYMHDPDTLVDWSYIEQIRLRSNGSVVCPICLDVPLAAKMTRCGHVYCWPCMLHYLALSDKSWRKCPICFESVHRKDLKSVAIVADASSAIGEEISFRLMKRERDSYHAVPVSEDDTVRSRVDPLTVDDPIRSIAYSKLLLAPFDSVKCFLQAERAELEAGLKAVQGEPEVCFFEEALELLSQRSSSDAVPVVEESKIDDEKFTDVEVDSIKSGSTESKVELESNATIVEESVILEEDDDICLPNVAPEDVDLESHMTGQKPFFFYQAVDGQNLFMNALNLRMLEMQYGSMQQCPLTITGKILEKESGSMTRELRSRLRSLSHLPITTAFELLELDMSPVVSPDVLSAFADPLNARSERRRRRQRQECQRERRIKRDTGLQYGLQPTTRIRLDSVKQFPKCGEENFDMASTSTMERSLSDSRSQSLNSVSSVGLEPEAQAPIASGSQQQSTPSFAQMLKVGGGSSGSGLRRQATWPKPSIVEKSVLAEDDEAYSSVARYQQSFSDAIAEALNRVDNMNIDEGASSKKKKKKKQKILFSSGMAFNSK